MLPLCFNFSKWHLFNFQNFQAFVSSRAADKTVTRQQKRHSHLVHPSSPHRDVISLEAVCPWLSRVSSLQKLLMTTACRNVRQPSIDDYRGFSLFAEGHTTHQHRPIHTVMARLECNVKNCSSCILLLVHTLTHRWHFNIWTGYLKTHLFWGVNTTVFL